MAFMGWVYFSIVAFDANIEYGALKMIIFVRLTPINKMTHVSFK